MPSAAARDGVPARDGNSSAGKPAQDGAADTAGAGTPGQAGEPGAEAGGNAATEAEGQPDRDRRSRPPKRPSDTDRPRRSQPGREGGPPRRHRPRAAWSGRSDDRPLPREERLHAISPVDGEPREVVVRYPADRVWGHRPLAVVASNLLGLAVFVGLPAGGLVAASRAGAVPSPAEWPPIALAALAVLAPVAAWLLLVGGADLARGLVDLVARRPVEGIVVRRRRFGGRDHTEAAGEPTRIRGAGGTHFLAVDDGHGRVIRAWRVPHDLYREVPEGARVRATVSRTLRFVRDLEVAAPDAQPDDAGAAAAAHGPGDELPPPRASRGRSLPAPPTDPTEKARALRPHRLDPVWLVAPDEASRALGRTVDAPRRTLGMVPPELEGGTIYGCTYVPAEDPRGDYIGITVVEGPPAKDFLQRGRRGATRIHGLGSQAWLGKRRVTVVKNDVVITIALHSRRVDDTGVALLRLARAASNRLR